MNNHVYIGKSRSVRLRHAYVHQSIKDIVIIVDCLQTRENPTYSSNKKFSKRLSVENFRGMRLKPTFFSH